MAFTIKGILHRKGEIDTRTTESGNFSRQEIVLKIRRFDSMTGEEMRPNYVVLEASTPALIYEIGRTPLGTQVECAFFPFGTEYTDKTTGELRYFSKNRLTSIKAIQTRTRQDSQAYSVPAPGPQPRTPDYSGIPDYMRPEHVPAPTAADEPPVQADDLRDADDLPFN